MLSDNARFLNSAVTRTSSSSSNGRPLSCAALILAIEDPLMRTANIKKNTLEKFKVKKLFCMNIPHDSKY